MKAETRVAEEYEVLAPHFGTVNCVLDIGCGLGVMDTYLVKHHGTKHVHLADGAGKGPYKHSFYFKTPVPWNDVMRGFAYVRDAVGDQARVVAHDVSNGANLLELNPEPDLIMSLLSCGFHYPASSYIPCFLRYPRARVLLDLRHRANHHPQVKGMEMMLGAGYRVETVVKEYNKGKRVLFSRV